ASNIFIRLKVSAAAGALFAFLLACDGQSIQDVARMVHTTWGPRLNHLQSEEFARALALAKDVFTIGESERWIKICEMLAVGNYPEAIGLLLEQNQSTMAERDGSAWIRVERNVLDVRFGQDARALPPGSNLPELWVNPYFIRSLDSIGWQIEGVPQYG